MHCVHTVMGYHLWPALHGRFLGGINLGRGCGRVFGSGRAAAGDCRVSLCGCWLAPTGAGSLCLV